MTVTHLKERESERERVSEREREREREREVECIWNEIRMLDRDIVGNCGKRRGGGKDVR